MIYEYQCNACGTIKAERRSVADRDRMVSCLCRLASDNQIQNMRRVVSLPVIVTRLRKDEPQHKYANGFSATDKLEFQRAEAKQSEALCDRIQDACRGVKEKPDSLADVYYGKV